MPESTAHTSRPTVDAGAAAAAWDSALAATYKALKAFSFYPQGHPLREKILAEAYQTLARTAAQAPVMLTVGRNGFSLPNNNAPFPATPMTRELAHEFFSREIQQVLVLPEISARDFALFLSLLAQDPVKIVASGGLTALIKKQGVETVILNEIDISAVFTRKRLEQTTEDSLSRGTGSEAVRGEDPAGPAEAGGLPDQASELSAAELIALMSREKDDSQYRQLARLLLARALPLKQERDFDRLFPILSSLTEQAGAPQRGAAARAEGVSVLQQLGLGEPAEHLLDHLVDPEFDRQKEIHPILKALGAEAIDAVIRRLIAAGLKSSRKPLTAALVAIGQPAEPALIALLRDSRWPVVLVAISLLAELGSRDAVKGLVQTAHHSDNRVRLESIRALATVGGMEASAALIELMKDQNQAIAAHAITWLGNSRNPRALQPLLQLALSRDLLGRQHALRMEALAAIGRIGDRRALEPLCRLVHQRYWIAPGRRSALKPVAIDAIGALGGDTARQFLETVAARGGQLARAASHALEGMAKRNQEHHE